MSKNVRYGLRRGELDTILDWLEPQITAKDKRWLNREWPGLWQRKSVGNATDEIRERDVTYLRLAIEGILDAKRGEKASYPRPVTTLAGEDLLQIAEMLKIEIPNKISGPELRDLIIGKIEASD